MAPSAPSEASATLAPLALPRSYGRQGWLVVFILVLGLLGASLVLVRGQSWSERPLPPLDNAQPRARGALASRDDGVLRLAGVGSSVPLARALADAYVRAHPSSKLHVHESLGTRAGVHALTDGVIDIALVDRVLRADEREAGLVVEALALDAVVLAAHPSVPETNLSSQEVVDLFAGRRAKWSDGSRVVVLQRAEDDGDHAVVAALIPGFAEADDAARRAGLWHVLFDDESILHTLMAAPGAVALFDLGTARALDLPIRLIALDGVEPSTATVIAGSYPLRLELRMVRHANSSAAVRHFIEFTHSEAGREIIRAKGYLPPLGAQP